MKSAFEIIEYINSEFLSKQLEKLKSINFVFELPSLNQKSTNTALANKKLVFTGTLLKTGRSEAKKEAEKQGAKVLSAMSSNVDFLVAGEKSGSKLKKAKELGVKVLTEQEFIDLIN